jgi:hypothetical protein
VATIHDEAKKLGRVLPRPSVVFHAYASADTPWVAQTLSHFTPVNQGKVSSNSSTHEATMFGDSICPVRVSILKCLFNRAQPTWALTDTDGRYHLGALNFRSDHYPSFPSSIVPFPLIAQFGLQLCQPFDYFAKPHRISIDRTDPITSRFQPLNFYQ